MWCFPFTREHFPSVIYYLSILNQWQIIGDEGEITSSDAATLTTWPWFRAEHVSVETRCPALCLLFQAGGRFKENNRSISSSHLGRSQIPRCKPETSLLRLRQLAQNQLILSATLKTTKRVQPVWERLLFPEPFSHSVVSKLPLVQCFRGRVDAEAHVGPRAESWEQTRLQV